MPKRKQPPPPPLEIEFDELTEDELEELEEIMQDFPEFEYLDDILEMDDEDFYTPAAS